MDELGSVAFFVVPVVIGFVAALLVVRRLGGLGTGLAALLFPAVLALVAVLVKHLIWDPDAGCSEECWGVLIYGVWWIGASVGAEAAILVGAVVRATRRRDRDPRASSP
jgi:hypothetical protein